MDRARIEAFLDRFVGIASGATTIGLLAVAERTGLLTWLGANQSGTADEIAASAGLDPRYVTEILSGLAAAGVVEYDADGETFNLPPEHALFVADETSPYFMGGWFDMIPAMLRQLDGVADATKRGGGVGFEEFGPEMVRGIDRGNAPSQRIFLTKRWLPAVPGLIDRLTAGIRVGDVGCGSGTAVILIAETFGNSEVVGFDISEESLQVARSRAVDLANVTFEKRPAEGIPTDPPFGLITAFDVIHDLADPLASLIRIRETLGTDGQFLMMEPNVSTHLQNNLDTQGALLYGVSTMLCMTQSLAAGGAGLGAAWGREKAEDYARRAGFSGFQPLDDIANKFSAFYLLSP